MKKTKVAIVRCEKYDYNEVYSSVKKGIELIGGINRFIKEGENILLKPNVLIGDKPDKHTTTHPTVFRAVGDICKSIVPNTLYYGDSPGFGKPETQLRKSGLKAPADDLGIKLADFENGTHVHFKDSPFTKQFEIANGVLEADGIISISKMKSHALTRVTGAVKNQFGCIPGVLKAEYHVKLPDPYDFSKMLVALNLYLKPRLYIMDGVVAMEGNGPKSGDPINMNVILASEDPIALDSVMSKLMNLDPLYNPTAKYGKEWGLGTYSIDEIDIVGENIDDYIKKDFDVVRKPAQSVMNGKSVSFVKNMFVPKPVINTSSCEKCGVCIEVCPVEGNAVNWREGIKNTVPVHDYKKCIRCYCCQELCPYSAITVKTPLLGKLFHRGK